MYQYVSVFLISMIRNGLEKNINLIPGTIVLDKIKHHGKNFSEAQKDDKY